MFENNILNIPRSLLRSPSRQKKINKNKKTQPQTNKKTHPKQTNGGENKQQQKTQPTKKTQTTPEQINKQKAPETESTLKGIGNY